MWENRQPGCDGKDRDLHEERGHWMWRRNLGQSWACGWGTRKNTGNNCLLFLKCPRGNAGLHSAPRKRRRVARASLFSSQCVCDATSSQNRWNPADDALAEFAMVTSPPFPEAPLGLLTQRYVKGGIGRWSKKSPRRFFLTQARDLWDPEVPTSGPWNSRCLEPGGCSCTFGSLRRQRKYTYRF